MSTPKKAISAVVAAAALVTATYVATVATVTTSRAMLVQFVVPEGSSAIWLPAKAGLWEWQPIDGSRLAEPRLILVRDPGARGDNALCLPVERGAGGQLYSDREHLRSARQLPIGYWTFIRPLAAGDPEF